MSTQNRPIYSSTEITNFYSDHLKQFGDSSKGVGWKNDMAQTIRFSQLAKVFESADSLSINDFGCGTGVFYTYMLSQGLKGIRYYGFDILDEMVNIAKKKLSSYENASVNKIESPSDMTFADYSVASGVFNVKYEIEDSEWLKHILETLEILYSKSRLGFSSNFLTIYSDKEYMQSYLYYADPLFIFDYCKKNFSKNVALLHDYGQYDFTLIVRRDNVLK